MSAGVAAQAAVVLVVAATLLAGSLGLRRARTTGDFYVASRSVSPRWNAAAISGEYLSAASFLGVAGLVLAYGYDALWYPVCYTAGYLVLLVLVAAPLRRSGAYTLPDFAQLRLGSLRLRRLASVAVGLIGVLYLVPQMQGAALTLRTQTGAPVWAGGLVVAVVVVVAVVLGGMRSITFAQALQFWLKFLALLIPALAVSAVFLHRHETLDAGHPVAARAQTVTVAAARTVEVPRAETLEITGQLDGRRVDGRVWLPAGEHRLGRGSTVRLAAGDTVPVVTSLPALRNSSWLHPLGSGEGHPLYVSLSLILAICLGTMGLPHVLVRFYTNADGRDSRRTTLVVLAMLSMFYLLPTVFGALGRHYVPHLLLSGNTDATVLTLPGAVVGGEAGVALTALVTAGAFAAFLSTASGLTVSIAGVLSQDLLGPALRRRGGPVGAVGRVGRIRRFRLAAVLAVGLPYLLSLLGRELELAAAVGLAFAVAAATFCPLLVLGIWWTRLTSPGAYAGMLSGGLLAGAAVLITIVHPIGRGWLGALLGQPAAWAVPLSLAVTVSVSLLTRRRIPADIGRIMVRLHAPEAVLEQLQE